MVSQRGNRMAGTPALLGHNRGTSFITELLKEYGDSRLNT